MDSRLDSPPPPPSKNSDLRYGVQAQTVACNFPKVGVVLFSGGGRGWVRGLPPPPPYYSPPEPPPTPNPHDRCTR